MYDVYVCARMMYVYVTHSLTEAELALQVCVHMYDIHACVRVMTYVYMFLCTYDVCVCDALVY